MIKQWPRLYTLDSKGKIRVFDCKVSIGMTKNTADTLESVGTDSIAVITSTGLLGGKLIEQQILVKAGKQKRTVEEQAIFQGESLWKSKLDEGYKDINMLRDKILETNVVTVSMDDERWVLITLDQASRLLPNWYCTNSNWDELPMLAHKYKDIKKPSYPYFIQPKLNGVRSFGKFAFTNPEETQLDVRLISRGGTYYQVPHIQEALRNLYDRLIEFGLPTNILLDGELYKHGKPLQEISGAARRESDGLFAANDWLEYHIYDVINLDEPDEPFKVRYSLLCTIAIAGASNVIKFVSTNEVPDEETMQAYHKQYVSDGYEGSILRDQNGEYEFNQRSKSLLKVKDFIDEEFIISGCEVDENKSVEESFVFTLQNNQPPHNIFKARPTGTAAEKMRFYMNIGDFIGKRATVRYFERSSEGTPTMGHVRSQDTGCLVEHIRPDDE